MESTLVEEQEEENDEKKGGTVIGNAGRLKQLYNKTRTVTKKYDKVKSGYDNVNNAKNKVQKGYRWFKSGEVNPAPPIANQQLFLQAAVNMASRSATVPQA